jgi:hypothetical protein
MTKKLKFEHFHDLRTRIPTAPLLDLLKKLQEHPEWLQDGVPARATLHKRLLKRFEHDLTVIRLPSKDGGTWDWDIFDPRLLLERFGEDAGDAFLELVSKTLAATQTPLTLMLYLDGITPGRELDANNQRKFTAFYFSFEEFGVEALQSTDAWLPLAVLRGTKMKTIEGGMANVVRHLCHAFFVNDLSFASVGAMMPMEPPAALRADRLKLLGDEVALKEAWDIKGSSGNVCCINCANVISNVAAKRRRFVDNGGPVVSICCVDPGRFHRRSSEDIWEIADMLEGLFPHSTRTAFEKVEIAAGVNHNPLGILLDKDLRAYVRPIEAHTHDPMHVLVSNGIFNYEMQLLLFALKKKAGITNEHIRMLLQADWRFPDSRKEKGLLTRTLFDPSAPLDKDLNHFRCSASEALSLYPLFQYFLETCVPQGAQAALKNEVECFNALCAVLDEINLARAAHGTSENAYTSLVSIHLAAFQLAYGATHVKPKHHAAFHIWSRFVRDCFAHERKNKDLKRIGAQHLNTSTFEKSVVRQAANQQLATLRERRSFGDHLQCVREIDGAKYALKVQSSGILWTKGDVVFSDADCGVVELACAADDQLLLYVRSYTLQEMRALRPHPDGEKVVL